MDNKNIGDIFILIPFVCMISIIIALRLKKFLWSNKTKTMELEKNKKRDKSITFTIPHEELEIGNTTKTQNTQSTESSRGKKTTYFTLTSDTLAVDYPGIFIPGFKLCLLEEHFALQTILASGGFGEVYMARILNDQIKDT